MRVELIAVPYDSAQRGVRMGAGPEHLLDAGLGAHLLQAGHQVQLRVLDPAPDSWRAEIRTSFELAQAVARAVGQAIANDAFPLVLSGNCAPAALGCIGGLQSAPSVFWFDAHGDFNTPETTVGGFLDGMALATLTGRCWPQLSAAVPGFAPVPEASVALLGARDFDPLEATALKASAIRLVSPEELRDRLPLVIEALQVTHSPAYVHLDLDVLDPSEGRVNIYAAPGGLTRADIAWAVATIGGAARLGAAAVTAFDPGSDPSGRTREAALALSMVLIDAAARRRN